MSDYSFLSPAIERVEPAWRAILDRPAVRTALHSLDQQLSARQQAGHLIYPARDNIFRALSFSGPESVRVVILGQDPYHGAGEAMGLSFSVSPGVKIPPSLRNIYKELARDTDRPLRKQGDLTDWARQGVLLLNSVLTVEADQAGSHGKLGWQTVTTALLDAVNTLNPGCVFLLWGNWARSQAERIDQQRHLVLQAAHPSPLSASRGFMQCGHFSQANQWLQAQGQAAIDWQRAEIQPSLI
ncbi:uracil-DNA glycosylase [Paludibacterium sp. THUN1379]|uniref:uracil-DNA glycosylase n=1 Tax=Paludibacterium sp. THUN1379 TaxID=3112107 RepID=UPI00308FE873|nr:uracil-DNA glycosylase [Paludibacterium sp. THUN1379]